MKKKYFSRFFLLMVSMLLVVSSCRTALHFQKPDVSVNDLYHNPVTSDTTNIADIPWRSFFSDPDLQALIDESLSKNLDLQVATQQIAEAEAYFSQSKASLFPSISAQANGAFYKNSQSLNSNALTHSQQYTLGLNSSWEADVWGKLSSAKRASYASLLYSQAGKQAVQTKLISDIATVYYTLAALDSQLVITQRTVQNNISLVETMKVLQEGTVVNGAAVVQTEASRYAAEVTIPDLKQSILEAEHTLSLLVGRVPGSIKRASLANQHFNDTLKVGVPAQLLRNRPDVMEAEYSLAKAYEVTNNAHAYFYPSLTITAAGGFTSADLQNFFIPGALFGNLIGGLTQPLFNQRTNRTRLEVAAALQQEALLKFENTLLIAGQEVSNTMGQYENVADKISIRSKQLEALNKSVDYTKELLKNGSANYTEVLTAQQNLLTAELNNVNDRLQQIKAFITLYRELGGGWK